MIIVNNFHHQNTIGIIGATIDAQAFILEAKKLGISTYLLCDTDEESRQMFGMTETIVGSIEDKEIREEFLMAIDILVYFDGTLSAVDIDDVQRTVMIPQGADLIAITQDKVLQKTFLESLSINIAPYVTVIKTEDIKEGVRSIGYPAFLSRNQVVSETQKNYFIYEESDIEKVDSLLKHGTYVLESWIVSELDLSITAVKNGNGEIKLFPIGSMSYRDDSLRTLQVPTEIDTELAEEIERVTRVILNEIDFQGVVTIDFFVTPANVLYVGTIRPFPNIFSRYTKGRGNLSAVEAHLKAITSLPLPEQVIFDQTTIFVPFYSHQTNIIDESIGIQPDWDFTFYDSSTDEGMQTKDAIGHILIQTDEPKKTLKILRDLGI